MSHLIRSAIKYQLDHLSYAEALRSLADMRRFGKTHCTAKRISEVLRAGQSVLCLTANVEVAGLISRQVLSFITDLDVANTTRSSITLENGAKVRFKTNLNNLQGTFYDLVITDDFEGEGCPASLGREHVDSKDLLLKEVGGKDALLAMIGEAIAIGPPKETRRP